MLVKYLNIYISFCVCGQSLRTVLRKLGMSDMNCWCLIWTFCWCLICQYCPKTILISTDTDICSCLLLKWGKRLRTLRAIPASLAKPRQCVTGFSLSEEKTITPLPILHNYTNIGPILFKLEKWSTLKIWCSRGRSVDLMAQTCRYMRETLYLDENWATQLTCLMMFLAVAIVVIQWYLKAEDWVRMMCGCDEPAVLCWWWTDLSKSRTCNMS